MCGFSAVLLQEDLQFSQEHLDEIKNKLQTKNRDYSLHCEEQLMFGSCNSHPFQFGEGRYSLVFNGRIYNKEELRHHLQNEGYTFHTDKSEEVIGLLFMEKGTSIFAELRGMFSVLIWDRVEQKIYGARDRFGIKPLYYAESQEGTTFSTEKKHVTLLSYDAMIDQEALQHYFTYQYVPEPFTLHRDIHKVKPGYYFIKEMNQPIEWHRYFHAIFQPQITDQEQLMYQIRESLINSIHVHMKSNQSLGSLLSGGIDSSLIVALAKEVNPDIKTFSVGFEREGYSEVDAAKKTADRLGVENISYIITPEEYIAALPEVMSHMEDPLADPSCVPLYFATREASKHVETVLSGEGADELFGGYNIYREPESLKLFHNFPDRMNQMLGKLSTIFPEGMRGKSFLERGTTPLEERYVGNAKMFGETEKQKLLVDYNETFSYQRITRGLYDQVANKHAVHQMQYIDLHTWLPGDILLKAEKMAKAHSLELRTPFLDKEVFQVAQGIPVHEKISQGTTKLILREAFKGLVPDELLYKKKLGFPVPLKYWLKKDLYSWAENLILSSQTNHLIHKKPVLQLLKRHKQGKQDYARKIWTVLMFMLWHQIYFE